MFSSRELLVKAGKESTRDGHGSKEGSHEEKQWDQVDINFLENVHGFTFSIIGAFHVRSQY